jgi:hypothetical protein
MIGDYTSGLQHVTSWVGQRVSYYRSALAGLGLRLPLPCTLALMPRLANSLTMLGWLSPRGSRRSTSVSSSCEDADISRTPREPGLRSHALEQAQQRLGRGRTEKNTSSGASHSVEYKSVNAIACASYLQCAAADLTLQRLEAHPGSFNAVHSPRRLTQNCSPPSKTCPSLPWHQTQATTTHNYPSCGVVRAGH